MLYCNSRNGKTSGREADIFFLTVIHGCYAAMSKRPMKSDKETLKVAGVGPVVTLRYGNTNTFFIRGDGGGLLIDTDYAGTLPSFYKAIKEKGITVKDISYLLATHYHPDHIGLAGELMEHGVTLLLVTCQINFVHFADEIFKRDRRLQYQPIDEGKAKRISCEESRHFLNSIGISGEIISIPSHSKDSVAVLLDNGDCIVGDLEPADSLEAYDDNPLLKNDWDRIMRRGAKRIFHAHANTRTIK